MGGQVSMPLCRRAPWEPGITHKQQVLRLYRQSIRTAKDWTYYWDYDTWIQECQKLQAEFRKNKDVSLAEGRVLVQKGLAKLLDYRHPEPMILPYRPGGCTYQRNVPMCPTLVKAGPLPPDDADIIR
ncbi:NADH dehydrogenase ubiquinone 1 beta subcomplex subunit 9 [Porphyridium purpureum]|uniref:NADH dehydrogenase [ubiquinone] 1 beta subcomplex subunit 9 n=1 Tax=Porphyridium purpureum TaxID=35688 RepID=A0A5J4Z6T1_PORPP|nr:NADH dehydrogenase ubiquinone 1 beta subcomplex subunit 9 [Porphyridium purpureum]|eukprot:POR5888..scf295_1